MAPLIACPHCHNHAIVTEEVCPHCGNTMRRKDGSIPRTAAAVVLGLTVAASVAVGCSDEPDPVPEYGVAATGSSSSSSTSSSSSSAGGAGGAGVGGAGGDGGSAAGGMGGAGGQNAAPEYGVAGSGA